LTSTGASLRVPPAGASGAPFERAKTACSFDFSRF